jgi:hypothetical protein
MGYVVTVDENFPHTDEDERYELPAPFLVRWFRVHGSLNLRGVAWQSLR